MSYTFYYQEYDIPPILLDTASCTAASLNQNLTYAILIFHHAHSFRPHNAVSKMAGNTQRQPLMQHTAHVASFSQEWHMWRHWYVSDVSCAWHDPPEMRNGSKGIIHLCHTQLCGSWELDRDRAWWVLGSLVTTDDFHVYPYDLSEYIESKLPFVKEQIYWQPVNCYGWFHHGLY